MKNEIKEGDWVKVLRKPTDKEKKEYYDIWPYWIDREMDKNIGEVLKVIDVGSTGLEICLSDKFYYPLPLLEKSLKPKKLKVTLEHAKEWFAKGGELAEIALSLFKEEQLKDAKEEFVYSWENCWERGGYEPAFDGGVDLELSKEIQCCHRTSATEKQALSMVAYAKLTHVIRKLNEDFEGEGYYTYYPYSDDGELVYSWQPKSVTSSLLGVKSAEACKILIRDNQYLLKQYYQID